MEGILRGRRRKVQALVLRGAEAGLGVEQREVAARQARKAAVEAGKAAAEAGKRQ